MFVYVNLSVSVGGAGGFVILYDFVLFFYHIEFQVTNHRLYT